jgi:pyruvate dehydrogenase E1 component
MCASTGGELNNPVPPPRPTPPVPVQVGGGPGLRPGVKPVSTQETFGRLLTRLADVPGVAERMVTTSPDVSVSTNLGGLDQQDGRVQPDRAADLLERGPVLQVEAGAERPAHRAGHLGDEPVPAARPARAVVGAARRAAAAGRHGLRPVRLPRARRPRSTRCTTAAGSWWPARRRGDAGARGRRAPVHDHAVDRPRAARAVTLREPAYAAALDWLLCDGLARLSTSEAEGGGSLYLRLSTRPLDQSPFAAAAARLGEDRLRADVLAGGYRLHELHDLLPGSIVNAALAALSLRR